MAFPKGERIPRCANTACGHATIKHAHTRVDYWGRCWVRGCQCQEFRHQAATATAPRGSQAGDGGGEGT